MKILQWTWRNGARHTIGAVAVERVGVVGGRPAWKAYIGVAGGYNEEADALHIAEWGAGLQEAEARAFFPGFTDMPYDY